MTKRKTTRPGGATNTYCPTLIEFVLDESGSMETCKAAVIDGFNAFLAEQRALSTDCQLTLTKFDGSDLRTPYLDLAIGMVPAMTDNTFCPNSSTNLHDAIGTRIKALEERIQGYATRPNVLMVVMTDGWENASRTYSREAIEALVKAHTDLGVTFVYLGSTDDATAIAAGLGFQPGNIRRFEASQTRSTFTDLAKATTVYRTTRTASVASSSDFFASAQ